MRARSTPQLSGFLFFLFCLENQYYEMEKWKYISKNQERRVQDTDIATRRLPPLAAYVASIAHKRRYGRAHLSTSSTRATYLYLLISPAYSFFFSFGRKLPSPILNPFLSPCSFAHTTLMKLRAAPLLSPSISVVSSLRMSCVLSLVGFGSCSWARSPLLVHLLCAPIRAFPFRAWVSWPGARFVLFMWIGLGGRGMGFVGPWTCFFFFFLFFVWEVRGRGAREFGMRGNL